MLMYDSDQPQAIPNGAYAAGYVDGYAASAWASPVGFPRFPEARRIAVFFGTTVTDGDSFDIENGDMTPAEAPAAVHNAHARGVQVPWCYCNRANRPAVENALIMAGVMSDQVALWIATLDGTQTVPPGPYPIAAVQYANSAMSGGHYDLSLVNAVFGPGGGTIGGDELKTYIVNTPTEGQWLLCLPSGYYVHLTTGAVVGQLQGDGATILAVDEQQHQNLLASRPSSGSGGTPPPPGPAEPTTLTLDVPAQTITGQLK
jgi:hypothetical protein